MEKTIKIKNHTDRDNILTDIDGKLLFDIASSKNNDCVVTKANVQYMQEPDNEKDNMDEPNILNIEITPDGYYVLSTERWAFDSLEDLLIPVKDIINRFTVASWGKTEFINNEK